MKFRQLFTISILKVIVREPAFLPLLFVIIINMKINIKYIPLCILTKFIDSDI
jgi:hypothetical protein